MAAEQQRWFTAFGSGHSQRYVERFRALAADGTDVDGEARFVDALVPRAAHILDAGCGPGRVGAALHARGHTVVGVDVDDVLVQAAGEDHPGPRWLTADLATLDLGETFDAIVLAGNVLVYLTPGTERAVLERMLHHLRPGGLAIAGFGTGHPYTVADAERDARAAGFVTEHRLATWDMRPWHDDADWAVLVLRAPELAAG